MNFVFKIRSCSRPKLVCFLFSRHATEVGPLAQSAERGADNAKVVSSTLTRTTTICFSFPFLLRRLKNILKMMFVSFFFSKNRRNIA